jgi:hypothetical protein
MDTHADGLPLNMQPHHEEDEDLDDPALAAELQVSFRHIVQSLVNCRFTVLCVLQASLGQGLFPSDSQGLSGAGGDEGARDWDTQNAQNMQKKSVLDRIQEDFPRTSSPVFGLSSPAKNTQTNAFANVTNKKVAIMLFLCAW